MFSASDLGQGNSVTSSNPSDAVLQALGASGAGLDPLGAGLDLLSLDELLAYLETRMSALSGRARDKMAAGQNNVDALNKSNKLTNELAQIKANTSTDPDKAIQAIDELLAAHGNDGTLPSDLVASLKDLRAELVSVHEHQQSGTVQVDATVTRETMLAAHIDAVSAQIKTQVDSMNRLDSMNLTELQSLMSQMSQASGLVSNMMASISESAKGVINNIRA
jgi:hypothetical protein